MKMDASKFVVSEVSVDLHFSLFSGFSTEVDN